MTTKSKTSRTKKTVTSGRLRIGDQWNAINIIAHSQTHPLKAICELAENAIDAGAKNVQILRRRQRGEIYLEVSDDGAGVAANESGEPDFQRIATHVCDSMKRHLDPNQRAGVHGEFGIGLLSFWSLGTDLRMVCAGTHGDLHEMHLARGERQYTIRPVRGQLPTGGTRVIVGPLLEATKKVVTGDKVDRYLSAELRDRIRHTGVRIHVVDRVSRKDLLVTPREFDGERMDLPRRLKTDHGDIHVELYFRSDTHQPHAGISLCKDGTRVLKDITELLPFQHAPWGDSRIEGLFDCPSLHLAPGTRAGIVPDACYDAFVRAVKLMEPAVLAAIDQREQAETDRASKQILRQVHKAFLTALRELPTNEYLFFDIPETAPSLSRKHEGTEDNGMNMLVRESSKNGDGKQAPLDESLGPLLPLDAGILHSVRISPRQARRRPGEECTLSARAKDEHGTVLHEGVTLAWRMVDGNAILHGANESESRVSSQEIGLVTIEVTATQDEIQVSDQVAVKFLDNVAGSDTDSGGKGLPSYRLEAEHGEPWRSRYDARSNEIIINSAHRDFLSSKVSLAKHRRYVGKLYAKEVVLINFPHETAAEVMERLIEITLRTEDAL